MFNSATVFITGFFKKDVIYCLNTPNHTIKQPMFKKPALLAGNLAGAVGTAWNA